MKVQIKDFDVQMEVKNNGIYDNAGGHRGDCFVTKTGLIWCEGRTRKANGKRVAWDEFIRWMNS